LNTQKPISEEELVPLLLKKSSSGLEILYDSYSATLYGIILRIVQDEELAEEILKKTFIKIWGNIAQYNASKNRLQAWLIGIARNMALENLKSSGTKSRTQYDQVQTILGKAEKSGFGSFNPQTKELKELIDKMDNEYKQILYLLFFEGFNQSEVALKLNIPLGTVKTRSRMAIFKLRYYFEQHQK